MLITSGIFHDKKKYSACDLKCRYCVFTLWGRGNEIRSEVIQVLVESALTDSHNIKLKYNTL